MMMSVQTIISVIARRVAPWQSILSLRRKKDGLLRYARNDSVINFTLSSVMPAKAGIHDLVGKRKKIYVFVSILFLILCSCPLFAALAESSGTIPFIGCPISIETGTITPTGHAITVNMPANIASRLAVYAGIFHLVLAPRGWNCKGSSSNGGASLSVYPLEGGPDKASVVMAITSGDGAEMLALGNYFPKTISKQDIRDMSADLNKTEDQFLVPKYPHDTIIYINDSNLKFITPANRAGLGNGTGLGLATLPKSSQFTDYGLLGIPIHDDPSVHFFGLQLPPDLEQLRPYILNFSKDCFLQNKGPYCGIDVKFPDNQSQ